ncbi:MAG: NAD-dependent epimerase, partial [Bacteroidota bacterium]
PGHQPQHNLERTIEELIEGLRQMNFRDKNFRGSDLIRLQVINKLLEDRIINSNLELNPTDEVF